MEQSLTVLALALFGAAAVAFTRQRRVVMAICGGLFVPVATAATLAVWWALSIPVAVALLAVFLALPAAMAVVFLIDLVWAPFALEMTYAAMLCWVLWPLLLAADFAGLLIAPLPA
ncbi:MAG: hypothetical protein GXY85_03845 [Candidatus Brocadiaceae bacterium]|nr:hypothetical protein [Candidatus Brocadiaceae bacterium]